MTLAERLDADLRGQLRRGRPLPTVMPVSMGEASKAPPRVQGEPHKIVKRPFPPLPEPTPRPGLDPNEAIEAAAIAWEIKRGEMLSRRQTMWHVRSRQAACLLLRRYAGLSLPAIAHVMGRSDHSAVFCSLRRAQRLLEGDVDWRRRFEIAEAIVKNASQRERSAA